MRKTKLSIIGENFYINGQKTYSEITGSNPSVHGLLMNMRLIQGVFDDKAGLSRYRRFGYDRFDPQTNTDDLIQALPKWGQYGLRAFTVGFQGGGPCYTIDNNTIDNNPFGADGTTLDPDYTNRMKRLIEAADQYGMIVIVSYFYGAQAKRFTNGKAIRNAVKTASNFLRDGGYTNVMIEIANEYTAGVFQCHPILHSAEGMASLIELAKTESGGMPVGSSAGGGGDVEQEVCEASDVIFIHGNACSRQIYYNTIQLAKQWAPNKPIVCNEDSQAIGQMEVALKTHTSWGYYNNLTKQEPPIQWGITKGEDLFFAHRMAQMIGIPVPEIPQQDQYYLQGFEPHMEDQGKRWVRLASLYPETINYVDFYQNGQLIYTSYDEPFTVHFISNWNQGYSIITPGQEWVAVIHLRNGSCIERNMTL